MKKTETLYEFTGGLLLPSPEVPVKNRGLVKVMGWWVAHTAHPVTHVHVRVGKRLVSYPLSSIQMGSGPEKEKSDAGVFFHLQIKVGSGLKRIRVFAANPEEGWELSIGNRLLWQEKACMPQLLDEENESMEAPAPDSDYQRWLDQDEMLLRSSRFLRDNQVTAPAPVSLTWLLRLDQQDPEGLIRTVSHLLMPHRPGVEVRIVDRSGWFARSSKRQGEFEKHPAISVLSDGDWEQALEGARGEWIGTLKTGDRIDPALIDDFSGFLECNPKVRLFYTDRDYLDSSGLRRDPQILPGWNRDLLTSQPYIGEGYLIHRELCLEAGGYEPESVDMHWSLLLRATTGCSREQLGRLCGIYFHLTKRGTEGMKTPEAAAKIRRMLESHASSSGIEASVCESEVNLGWRTRYVIPMEEGAFPLVSLLIPTRDGLRVLKTCVDSILEKTDYPNYEILLLDNDSTEVETIEYFEHIRSRGVRVVSCPGQFNFSSINNRGVREARGSIIGFLNNDLEVIEGGWLTELVSHACRPGIGAVGPKLLYPDGSLQHAGVLLGVGHVAAHAFRLFPDAPGTGPVRAHLIQNYSALTAACLILKRSVFEEVGGYDEVNLPITNNDVDLCIRIREAGYRNLYTPYATLFHHESATRGPENTPEKLIRYKKEVDYMWQRWSTILIEDPAYNTLLTRFSEDFGLASAEELQRYVPGELF